MLVIAFAQLADGGRASEGSSWAGRWSRKLLLAVCPGCIPPSRGNKRQYSWSGHHPEFAEVGGLVWSRAPRDRQTSGPARGRRSPGISELMRNPRAPFSERSRVLPSTSPDLESSRLRGHVASFVFRLAGSWHAASPGKIPGKACPGTSGGILHEACQGMSWLAASQGKTPGKCVCVCVYLCAHICTHLHISR